MKTRFILLVVVISQIFNLSAFSREDTIKLGRSFGLQMSGFARIDFIHDTRQTNEAVEGLFTFFPLPPLLDANGNDINATPKANFSSISSRLSSRFYAPNVFGAKSTAYIEFDFTGTSNTNGVRMRQAWVNLAWTKSNLLLGRTWHPFATGCVPNVIGLNTGAPFWAFNRSDMVRFDYKPGNWLLQAFALYQSDYASLGPDLSANPSGKKPVYLRDAIIPELAAHIAYKTPDFQLGAIGSVKSIKPRQFTISPTTTQKYKTNEKLTTGSAQAYAQYQASKLVLKAQATYTQNTTESLQIGGYAVSVIDQATGHEKYTPTQYLNYWLNVDYGKKVQVGLFLGYLNSLGTLENVATENRWYARAHNIKYMYRISPHLFYNVNNFQLGAEFEYTTAAYGEVQNDNKAKIVNTSEIANFRTNLLICFYF
jgi:hypothetical protein